MKARTRVYVAGPITTSGNLLANIAKALDAGTALLERGYAPYIPHLTCYWEIHRPMPYEVWMGLDLEFLAACDVLLRLEGESRGADREVAYAKKVGIPVYLSLDTLCSAEPVARDIPRAIAPRA